MIKVLINGTPIYRLEFQRKKYKTVGRKPLTVKQALQAINKFWNPMDELDTHIVSQALETAAGGKPLYETTAFIHFIDAKRDEPPLASATSRQHSIDENRRIIGRGQALKKLLALTNDKGAVFTPLEKQAITDAYNNRSKQSAPKLLPPVGGAGTPPIAQVRKTPAVGKVLSFTDRPSLTLAA